MNPEVVRDLSQSAADFQAIVWPIVREWCGRGELILVEQVSAGGFANTLDMMAGIDGWQLVDERNAMRGLASRIQYGQPWPSFTIRLSRASGATTEMEKRLQAVADERGGWLLPTLTVQAYLNEPGGRCLCAAMCYTRDLYDYIRQDGKWSVRVNPADRNTFAVVWWRDLLQQGYRVRVHNGAGLGLREFLNASALN